MVPLILFATANVLAFAMMGVDKAKARAQVDRVPERVLLTFAIPGAGVGAWFGMSVFRHKTAKRSFQIKMVLATLVGAAGWGTWLWTQYAQ